MRLFSCVLVFFSVFAFAANVTFEASFDGSFNAGVAKGASAPLKILETVDPFADGLKGKAVKIGPWKDMPTPGTTEREDRKFGLLYDGKGNINSQRGAVSFWVNPVDWSGKDSANHRMFFTAYCTNNSDRFTIYKVLHESTLYVYFWNGSNTQGKRVCSIANWKSGGWHNVVCNWNDGYMNFFVDGEFAMEMAYEKFKLPFGSFRVGFEDWAYEEGASLMDELKIYDAPLNPNEIKALFKKVADAGATERFIRVGRTAAPVLDGKVSFGEYSFGSDGFMDFPDGGLSKKKAMYYVAQDGKKLYLAVKSQIADNPDCVKGRLRDAEIWEDENIELHFKVPGGLHYQFIINCYGGIYDSSSALASWNAQSLETKSSIVDGMWTIECSLDLSEFEGLGKELGINIARSFRMPKQDTCICSVRRNLGFADTEAFIKLKLEEKPLPCIEISETTMALDGVRVAFEASGKVTGRLVCGNGVDSFFDKSVAVPPKARLDSGKIQSGTVADISVADADGVIFQNSFAFTQKKEQPFTLHYLFTDFDLPSEDINFVCSSMVDDAARGSLKLEIKTLDGKPVAEKTYPLKDLGMNFTLKYPGATLPFGFYAFTGTLVAADGSESVVFLEDWIRPEKHELPDYLDASRIKVQAPWTPIEQEGRTVKSLVKTYVFNDDFLLESVVANGNNILGAPMRLEINGLQKGKAQPPVFDNHGDYCFLTQKVAYGDINVTVKSRVDYDGMVKVAMTLEPPKGGSRLSSVRMVMPFDGKTMEYVNGNSGHGNTSGKSGLLTGDVWEENLFKNFAFWIGNCQAGFGWVAKNMKGWHCNDVVRSLSLKPEGNLRTAYIPFVDEPFDLKELRTIEFAVMASPGRPSSPKVDRMLKDDMTMWWRYDEKYFDYIDPHFIKPRPAGWKAFPYNSVGTSGHCPHWNYYQKEWNRYALGYVCEDLPVVGLSARNASHWVWGCLNSVSFMEFKLSQIFYALDRRDMEVHNLYFDLVGIGNCTAENHGCLWTDDFGRKWGSCDWENRRVFFQAIREKLLKKNSDGLISFHSHNQRLPMLTDYCDIQVGGEDFVTQVGTNGNYYDLVNSDILRSYSVAYGLGPKCVFIPQFARALLFIAPGTTFDESEPKNRKATRHLLNMLFIHDIDAWQRSPEATKLANLKRTFGWDASVEMHPFWDAKGFFSIESDSTGGKVIATVFSRQGRFLLWTLNDSDSNATAVFNLDIQRLLGKAPTKLNDFYQPERKHSMEGSKLRLDYSSREPIIIWIE